MLDSAASADAFETTCLKLAEGDKGAVKAAHELLAFSAKQHQSLDAEAEEKLASHESRAAGWATRAAVWAIGGAGSAVSAIGGVVGGPGAVVGGPGAMESIHPGAAVLSIYE